MANPEALFHEVFDKALQSRCTDEVIIALRENGVAYSEIAEYLKQRMQFPIAPNSVKKRYFRAKSNPFSY